MVDVTLRSYFLAPAIEPKLTNPSEVHEVIQDLNVGKAPDPNGIPKRALKHPPQQAVSLLIRIFNAVNTHHLPTMRMHEQVISFLKPETDPALPHPIGLLVCWTRWQIIEKILLTRILSEVSKRRLIRDKHFGLIRIQHTMS